MEPFPLFSRINSLKEMGYSEKEFMNNVWDMYEAIFDLHKERIEMEWEENFK